MKKWIIIISALLSISYTGISQNPAKEKTKQLVAFAKLYGYVKYFHPSDEAAELDWDAFAIYGSKIILTNESDNFSEDLKALFSPIAPTIKVLPKRKFKHKNELQLIENLDRSSKYLMWTHYGNGKLKEGDIYSSTRTQLNYNEIEDNFCPMTINIENYILAVPNIVSLTNVSNDSRYNELTKKLKFIISYDNWFFKSKILSIGNLVNIYNSVKHFYPYFNKRMSENWDESFRQTIQLILKDTSERNTVYWSRLLLTHLRDAHVDVYKNSEFKSYPDIFIRHVEDKFVIYNTTEEYSRYRGFRVEKIDGESIHKLVNEEMKLVSYNVESFGYQEALQNILEKNSFELINFELENANSQKKTLELSCNLSLGSFISLGEYTGIENVFHKINNTTCYINLVDLASIQKELNIDSLRNFENIIIDIRGYPVLGKNDKNTLLSHFIQEDDTLDWLFVPIVKKPNQSDNSFQYKPYGWNLVKNSKTIKSKLYVLIDHMAISYAESIIGYFANLSNTMLIGSPTAGANGNINDFTLPTGITYEYTGMKVLKHDGSRLHGIGFLPDVEVRPTIQGIIEGRDEVLEKAIELASENK